MSFPTHYYRYSPDGECSNNVLVIASRNMQGDMWLHYQIHACHQCSRAYLTNHIRLLSQICKCVHTCLSRHTKSVAMLCMHSHCIYSSDTLFGCSSSAVLKHVSCKLDLLPGLSQAIHCWTAYSITIQQTICRCQKGSFCTADLVLMSALLLQRRSMLSASWQLPQSFHAAQWSLCAVPSHADPSSASNHGDSCMNKLHVHTGLAGNIMLLIRCHPINQRLLCAVLLNKRL